MNNHIKTKHSELLEGKPKRGRGRPRKYPPKSPGDFETTKYEIFFKNPERTAKEETTIDVEKVVTKTFDFIYNGNYSSKLFSHPKSYEENPILKNLVANTPAPEKPKNLKTCDEVFYEYLYSFKDKTNEKYFELLLKFVLLFRECYDNSKTKDLPGTKKRLSLIIFHLKVCLIYAMNFMENLWSLITFLIWMSNLKKMKLLKLFNTFAYGCSKMNILNLSYRLLIKTLLNKYLIEAFDFIDLFEKYLY